MIISYNKIKLFGDVVWLEDALALEELLGLLSNERPLALLVLELGAEDEQSQQSAPHLIEFGLVSQHCFDFINDCLVGGPL